MLNFYYSLVQPILSYGLVAQSGGESKAYLNRIVIARKLIIKSILGKPIYYSTVLVFEGSELFTIKLYTFAVLQRAFKYLLKIRIQ